MATAPRPIRRVVTGNDAQGRSRVLYDSAAPNVNANSENPELCMTDLWVFDRCPAPLAGERDDGRLKFNFEPPPEGGHFRIVQSPGKPADYNPASDSKAVPMHAPRKGHGSTWFRGGQNAFTSPMHKSPTLDIGIALEGEKTLVLDAGEILMRSGDVVVQQATWHAWINGKEGALMAFVMLGSEPFDKE